VNFPAPLAVEVVDDLAQFGVTAFTTGRSAGSFGTASPEPVSEVMGRWSALRAGLRPLATRLATAVQVHGSRVVVHDGGWEGWLRVDDADGHLALRPGTAMAVSVADCVPVFLAHPSGSAGLLHSGWRGTAGRILEEGIRLLAQRGVSVAEIRVHLGPAICGRCYEVSHEVMSRLTGTAAGRPARVDLRGILADQARALGTSHISVSPLCTRCHNDRLYSHRGGDSGRQVAVMVAPSLTMT
jgi:polyphenol oxidase